MQNVDEKLYHIPSAGNKTFAIQLELRSTDKHRAATVEKRVDLISC